MPSKEAYHYLSKIEDSFPGKKISIHTKKKCEDSPKIYFWKCKSCNTFYDDWAAYCNVCKKFGSIKVIINEYLSKRSLKETKLLTKQSKL